VNDLDEGEEHGLRIAVPFVANESEILLGVHQRYARRGTREPGVSARARKEGSSREGCGDSCNAVQAVGETGVQRGIDDDKGGLSM
jgi:hypothetical protein